MPNLRPHRSRNGARKSASGIFQLSLGIGASLWLSAISLCPVITHASEVPEQHAAAADENGFKPVDLNTVERINGKSLMLIAYAIIFGVFVFYTGSLLKREKTVKKETQRLEKQLGKTP